MRGAFASPAEIGARLSSGRFWLRVAAGIGVGHVYAAVGFAAVVALLAMASKRGPLALEDASLAEAVLRIPWKLQKGIAIGLSLVPIATWFMAPLTPLLAPVPIAAAVVLKSGRAVTMLVGAASGLLVGWPLSIAVYGFRSTGDAVCALGAMAAGAMFALGMWQCCIGRYPLSGGRPLGLARWWTSLSPTVRVVSIAAPILVIVLW